MSAHESEREVERVRVGKGGREGGREGETESERGGEVQRARERESERENSMRTNIHDRGSDVELPSAARRAE